MTQGAIEEHHRVNNKTKQTDMQVDQHRSLFEGACSLEGLVFQSWFALCKGGAPNPIKCHVQKNIDQNIDI
eukprot:716749-Amphidinium_carterae.1